MEGFIADELKSKMTTNYARFKIAITVDVGIDPQTIKEIEKIVMVYRITTELLTKMIIAEATTLDILQIVKMPSVRYIREHPI